jgi:Arc/MetJ-type ribon-helix-helix transcriptional regulator
MRYIIDISPQLAEQLGGIVSSGKYRTVQDFVKVAVENQLYLESKGSQELGLVSELSTPKDSEMKRSSRDSTSDVLRLPHALSQIKTIAVSGVERPKYLWGQYNRFLPVKVVTRVAANLLAERDSETVPLAELQEVAAEAARQFGKVVERSDRLAGRKRGTILSAGLPVGKEEEKAKARFKTQFVGSIVKNRMEGASPALKFIEMKRDSSRSAWAGITDFGLKFASLSNPVLDNNRSESPFSHEEVGYLLDHIWKEVPQEANLMQYILERVKEGIATPEELNQKLHYDRLRDWKHNEVITMRAGLVSRLSELGLLTRQKFGVNVKYLLTDIGEKYRTASVAQQAT